MKYIRFVIIFICLLVMYVSPACAFKTDAMIHYSEPAVNVGDEITLEQGYSFKVSDMNSKSGDIMIKLYLNGREIDLDDSVASDDEPLKYIRSVTDEDDKEADYLILRITPRGSVKESGGKYYSTIYIEQYLDPAEDADDYIILDKSYSLKSTSVLELAHTYDLKITGIEDDEVSLELLLNDDSLKEDTLEEGEYFYYTTYSGSQPDAIFIARIKAIMEYEDSVTVFLDQVSLKQKSKTSSDSQDTPDEIDIQVVSPDGGDLKAGNIAIITYELDDKYSEVRILLDGKFLDSRADVSRGTYKAVTGELAAGVHTVMLIVIEDDDDDFSYYSEDFSVSVNIKDNISESITGAASSAVETIEGKLSSSSANSGNNSSETGSVSSEEKSGSGFSNVISLIITAGVFVVFFVFYNKFR